MLKLLNIGYIMKILDQLMDKVTELLLRISCFIKFNVTYYILLTYIFN